MSHQESSHAQRLRAIQSASDLGALRLILTPLLLETGFGASSLKDAETGEETSLDYLEIAECLTEADRQFFQQAIELLVLAHQRSKEIMLGIPPRESETEIPVWQQFL
jgi:hypothetical protein